MNRIKNTYIRAPLKRHLCAWPFRSCLNENLSQLLEGEDGTAEAVVRSLNRWQSPSIGKFRFHTSRPGKIGLNN